MSAAEVAQTIKLLDAAFAGDCCQIAAIVIYAYDRFLTFRWDVDLIWQRRNMSVATGLYVLIHISVAVYLFGQVIILILTGCESGYIMTVVQLCAGALFHTSFGAFTALRAYAISNRSISLTCAIFSASLVLFVGDIYEISTIVLVVAPEPVGCVLSSDGTSYRPLIIAGEAANIVAEFLLVAATWRHAHMIKFAKDAHVEAPITTILLRDGTVYFVTILALLIITMTLAATNSVANGFVSPLTDALQVILISHFYLNLREANSMDMDSGASQISDVRFTRVVGSLAGSLPYGMHSSPGGVDAGPDSVGSDEEFVDGGEMDGLDQESVCARPEGSIGGSEPCASNGMPSPGLLYVEEVPRTEAIVA
ncbi:uncharacterized protein B0H18DRAFT_1021675 [Fomitopsis serialis]|uniref:uncharacterized protein n=1 Tax=Fomitopsis serialis TaxID=139415 RepID=UPI002008D70A|nr:uncharacterized protein B0H18DRAFT_1021675 [Neoantrodia serialis]KAH9921331.1 hypothetical protein B0H18DRAFT_1021675 [Neoantrodia serialis]